MIPRYRNRALKQLGLSILFFILIFVLAGFGSFGVPKVIIAVGAVTLGIFSFVYYAEGSVALAKAKGYDSSVVAAIIVVGFFCLGGLLYIIPLILLFGLKDKTKHRRYSRGGEREPARRNPPAKLPPLRE